MSIRPTPSFDQVVKGDINIKQLSKKKYKITFNKIGNFLRYQVWSDSSKKLNDDRSVYYQNAKQWIIDFNSLNASLKASNKFLFTPTTVMEIGNKKYLFVIDEAKLNNDDRVVFKVSTEEIKLSGKKMLKLPCGHHDGVRFDIDSNGVWWCPLNDSTALEVAQNLSGISAGLFKPYWTMLDQTRGLNVLSLSGVAMVVGYGSDLQYAFASCGGGSAGFSIAVFNVDSLQDTNYSSDPNIKLSLYDIIVNNNMLNFFTNGT